MSKRHKRVLNYTDQSLIVISTITWCISISAFASLVGIPIGIASTTVGLKICVITAGIISKALINSNISHDEFILINFYKEKIKSFNNKERFKLHIKQCYPIV